MISGVADPSAASAPITFLQGKIRQQGELLGQVQALADKSRKMSAYMSKLCSWEALRPILWAKGLAVQPQWLMCCITSALDVDNPEAYSVEEQNRSVILAWEAGRPEADWEFYRSRPPPQTSIAQSADSFIPVLEQLKAGQVGRVHWQAILGKMRADRQLKVVRLLADLNDYSKTCSVALLMATPADQLVNSGRACLNRRCHAQLVELEGHFQILSADLRLALQNLVPDTLLRTAQIGYLRRLAADQDVAAWMRAHGQTIPKAFL